jgi:hypothetical protein
MRNRREILALLETLPSARIAGHHEVLDFADDHRLYGRGIGWIDAHLLASALLSNARLVTLDRRLSSVAARVGIPA